MAPKRTNSYISVDEDEGLFALRHYELEAYASVVTAFRAEGGLNEDKQNVLAQLQKVFGISKERHKAEVRRATNDEKLSSIASQIHGSSFDLEWQREGRRLFGVLSRPTPITAYTRIADEIAQATLGENLSLQHPGDDDKVTRQTTKIHPPDDPSDTLKTLKHIMPPTSGGASTMQSENPPDVTDDILEHLHVEDSNIDTNWKSQAANDGAKADSQSDSYVYLPSGTVVQLEASSQAETNPTRMSLGDVDQPTQSKRRKISSSSHDAESSFVIKEVYRPEDIQSYKQRQASSRFREDKLKSERSSSVKAESAPAHVHPAPSTSRPRSRTSHRSGRNHNQPHLMAKVEKAPMVIQHTPVPPEHLYPVGPSNRVASHARAHNASWATKHNVTNGGRSKRRVQRSPLSSMSRRLSGYPQGYARYNFSSEKKAHAIAAKDNQLSSFEYDNSIIEQTRPREHQTTLKANAPNLQIRSPLRMAPVEQVPVPAAVEPQGNVMPPQRVFRPTLHMTTSAMKKYPVSFSPDRSSKITPSSQLVHSSFESGLAPVSTIVSHVASPDITTQSDGTDQQSRLFPAISKVKIIRSAGPRPGVQPIKSIAATNTQGMDFTTEASVPVTKFTPADELINISAGIDRPVKQSHSEYTMKDFKHIHIQSTTTSSFMVRPSAVQTTFIKTFKDPGKANLSQPSDQDLGSLAPSGEHDPTVKGTSVATGSDNQRSSVSLAASGLCALATTPIFTGFSGGSSHAITEKVATSAKPSTVQISSANIIKVTPRPLSVTKGLPIVTQIGGSRITKTLTTVSGTSKPSIIVVHRPPGRKSITATSAKFLEIGEGSGKQIAKVKTVSSIGRAISKPTSIIKPLATKLLDSTAAIRPIQDGNVIPTNFHKVITKGKMRQLVLKPTSSVQQSHILQSAKHDGAPPVFNPYSPSPSTKSLFQHEIGSPLSVESPTESPKPPTTLQATSTMKALMAIQKGSPHPVDPNLVKASVSNPTAVFPHAVSAKQHIKAVGDSGVLKKPKQRFTVINTKSGSSIPTVKRIQQLPPYHFNEDD